jgi:hypothetical protein
LELVLRRLEEWLLDGRSTSSMPMLDLDLMGRDHAIDV